ncbi:MAG TPA: DUF6709 family protein [Candidatus Acidoferrales bacterium]|nr:DUF6709 family protein [Candidatus Acidoferrales bacterium]
MTDGFLASSVRRLARNFILAGLLGLAVVAGFFWLEGRYLYNFFHGPFPIDRSAVLSMRDASSLHNYFVTLQGDETLETGRQEVSTEYFITTHSPILALRLGDRLLLVKSSDDTAATALSGALTSIPNDMYEGVVKSLYNAHPELNGKFLPVMLDATSFRRDGYFGITFGILLGGLWIWMLFAGLRWRSEPATHPVYKKLARFGSPQQLEMDLDAQFRGCGGGEAIGSARLAPMWLVNQRAFSLTVMRTADVVWVYPRVVKHYHGFIPTGKSFSIIAYDRSGAMTEIAVKKKTSADALKAIGNRAKNAIFGYSPALIQLWRKNRAQFIQQVDAKIAQANQAAVAKHEALKSEERTLVRV